MSLALLYLLASIDGLLLGHHSAIGLNPLVEKGAYWRGAFVRGFLAGQLGLAAIAATAGCVLLTTADRRAFVDDASVAADRMLLVFVPYALLVVSSALLYLTRWRLAVNVLVLGPFTLLREPVILAGIALGLFASPTREVAVVLGVALVVMTSMRAILRRTARDR